MERPASIKALGRALPTLEPGQIAAWLDAGKGAPVTRATMVQEAKATIVAALRARPPDVVSRLVQV